MGKSMTKVTARAGWSEVYPENTLLALQRAVEYGADRIEFDVQQSSDGALILHHFYVLGSTDNGEGLIFERDLSYLKSLDAGGWKSPEFVGERMPLLKEAFATCGRSIEYEIDLKGFTLSYLEDVLNLVRACDLLDHVELTSAFSFLLIHSKRLQPEIKTGMFANLLLGEWMPLQLQQAITLANARLGEVDVVHCPVDLLTIEFVRKAQSEGYIVHASNCDSETDLLHAYALGVDQLSTNQLELAVNLRGSTFS